MAHLGFLVYMLIQTVWSFPESPRFNYSKDKFLEAKENLHKVARINGVRHFNPQNFKFDNEYQQELIAEMMENQHMSIRSSLTVKKDGGNEYGLSDREYIINVVLFSLLFSCFSFCFWLTDF